MKKLIKHLSTIGLIVLFFSLYSVNGIAEDEQLLYDLRYDESKSVLYGKTRPHSNVYINDVAGNIVADDNGDFEMPVPKGLKISTILMLDAEGDTSTDLRFNFEKNTIETESSKVEESSSTQASSSEVKTEDSSKEEKEKEKESETKESTKEIKNTETTDASKESSSRTKQTISSESYDSSKFEEEKRSLVWLWTLLAVIGILGLAVAIYLWYKKKIEKEEAEKKATRRKRHSKNKRERKKKIKDDLEDDLYASIKLDDESGEGKSKKSRHKQDSGKSLDTLIDSEIKKSNLKTEQAKTSRTRNGKKRKKKKSTKD